MIQPAFRRPSTFLAVLGVAAVACEPPPENPGALPSEDVAAIEDMVESYRLAVMARDWETAAAFYTDQGIRNAPNGPEVDVDSEELEEAYGALSAFDNPPEEIVGRGDLAYVKGSYSVTAEPEGASAPTEDEGKYVAILHKQDDARWRIAYLIFNSDRPPAEPEP